MLLSRLCFLYADRDSNGRGEDAANKLMAREQAKREVQIIIPQSPIPEGKKGIDWLDCVNELIA